MEPRIGLSPVVIDIVEKTSPTLDELAFGSTVILLLNYLVLRYLIKKNVPMHKHMIIMICSDCAFLINNFVKILVPSLYGPIIAIYGVAFFIVYYLVMYKTPGGKIVSFEFIPSFMMAMFYTFGVIAFEGFWRVGFWAQDLTILFTNPDVSFFRRDFVLAVVFAILATIFAHINKKMTAKKVKSQKTAEAA